MNDKIRKFIYTFRDSYNFCINTTNQNLIRVDFIDVDIMISFFVDLCQQTNIPNRIIIKKDIHNTYQCCENFHLLYNIMFRDRFERYIIYLDPYTSIDMYDIFFNSFLNMDNNMVDECLTDDNNACKKIWKYIIMKFDKYRTFIKSKTRCWTQI